MDDRIDYAKENIHRLVQAGMGEQAQLDRSLREETLLLLKGELSAKPAFEFPPLALGLIAATLALIGYWWVAQFGSAPSWEASVIGILIGVNLLCIPLGSIVIVNRRRHV